MEGSYLCYRWRAFIQTAGYGNHRRRCTGDLPYYFRLYMNVKKSIYIPGQGLVFFRQQVFTDLTGRVLAEMKCFAGRIVVMTIIMQDLYRLYVTERYEQEICYEPI
jgi:hypothetical protein